MVAFIGNKSNLIRKVHSQVWVVTMIGSYDLVKVVSVKPYNNSQYT